MTKVTRAMEKRAGEYFDNLLSSLDIEITEDEYGLLCMAHKNKDRDKKKNRLSVKTKLAVSLYLCG